MNVWHDQIVAALKFVFVVFFYFCCWIVEVWYDAVVYFYAFIIVILWSMKLAKLFAFKNKSVHQRHSIMIIAD